MSRFLYKAKNNQGEVVTGSVRAANVPEAEEILTRHNLVATDIVPEQTKSATSLFVKKVSIKDKVVFSRQLATMMGAGLSLTKAINLLINQARSERLKTVFTEIYRDLEEGYSFSSALAKHPDVFDRVYVSVVNSGESSGKLDVVLDELAEELENDNAFINKVKGALYYPVFIMIVLVLAVVLLMIFVIPKLQEIFNSSSNALPLSTKMLISLSSFMANWWWILLIIIIGSAVFLKYWLETDSGERAKSKAQITTPGLKTIYEGIAMYRFTRVMSMLIGAGVPLLDALRTGSAVVNNVIYEESIIEASRQIEKGVPLSVQLLRDETFPPLIGNMVAVGEETGDLDNILAKISKYYEEATSDLTKAISSLIEPAVLVMVGLGVAFVVFSIYLPIYQMNSMVQ